MPAAARVMMSAVPPWDTNNSGTPNNGTKPSIAAMFKNDSVIISMAIPIETLEPNESGERVPIRNELIANNKYKRIRKVTVI